MCVLCSSCARRSHVKNSQCKIYYTVPSLLRVACITPIPQNRTRKPNWSQPAHNKLSCRISPTERGQGPVALTVGSVLRGTGRLPSACRSASSEALSTSACRSWMSSSSMYWRRRATSPSREASSRRSSSTGFCETHTLGGSYRHAPRGHTHAPRVTHTPRGVTHTPRGSHTHTRPTGHTHKPCGPHCRAQTDSRVLPMFKVHDSRGVCTGIGSEDVDVRRSRVRVSHRLAEAKKAHTVYASNAVRHRRR